MSDKLLVTIKEIREPSLRYWIEVCGKKKRMKKSQNNKKEICNDKYKHTRDRLFGLHCGKKKKKNVKII